MDGFKYEYTATVYGKGGRVLYRSAKHATDTQAVIEAFRAKPKAKRCSCGYGYNGSFNILTYRRKDYRFELGE